MLLIYGQCQHNSVRARDLYAERYPQRSHPTRRTFKYLYDKLRTTGSLTHRKNSRQKQVTNEETEIGILATVVRDPCVSSRKITRESGVSQRSVIRVLRRHKYHPYHISLHQELTGTDFMNRIEFCRWTQLQIQRNNSFINWILFSDEATFTNYGNINLHNMHFWSTENSHWLRQVARQKPWSVNVWCGIIEDRIIGPYFIERNLNGRKYTTFLQETLGPLLEEIPLETRNRMWYQHDGCPAHFSLVARNEL
ncbi:hypothetical protein WN55_07550 [Dufourea novaeangliae]|uniref:DUF4817 domain-containing protein n=1 Tax=Dufourea novaeangliae TaxID=178035 RepID=A0A154P4I9_DUFNO|nr:hypothetical protein WN55_07550 [Dufourea novaeangliae]